MYPHHTLGTLENNPQAMTAIFAGALHIKEKLDRSVGNESIGIWTAHGEEREGGGGGGF